MQTMAPNAPVLAGPTLPPVRGPADCLIVMVHGYGADRQDLIGLADHWRHLLPGAAFLSSVHLLRNDVGMSLH